MAVLLDYLLLVPGLCLFVYGADRARGAAYEYYPSPPHAVMDPLNQLGLLGLLLFVGVLVVQIVYLALFHQTLGKPALGLQILRADGREPGAGRVVVKL